MKFDLARAVIYLTIAVNAVTFIASIVAALWLHTAEHVSIPSYVFGVIGGWYLRDTRKPSA